MLTAASMEFRSDAATSHTSSSEDIQPNETINKRQRAAPPTILSASIKPALPYKNYARRRYSSSGGHSSAIRQGAGSLFQQWSQDTGRGNNFKLWRGASSASEGARGRLSKPSSSSRLSSRTESPQTNHSRVQAVKSLTPDQRQNDRSSSLLESVTQPSSLVGPPQRTEPRTTAHYSHPQSPGASSFTAKPLTTTPYVPGSNTALKPSSDPTFPSTYQAVVLPKTEPPEQLPISDFMKSAPISPIISISPPMSPVGTTPSAKRRKLDHIPDPSKKVKAEEIEPFVSSQQSHSQPPTTTGIKIEKRTPSPPPRRLVRESCSFYPLPDDCKKSNPEHKKNRQAFFTREYNVLKCFGLKRTKVIFRDDGMVIEWVSNIPVWSDTLQPEPSNISSVIDQALRANNSSSPGRRKSTSPRRSSSHTFGSPVVAGDSPSSSQATSSARLNSPPSKPARQKPPSSSSIPLPRRRLPPPPKPPLPQATVGNENVDTAAPTPITNMGVDHPQEIHPELERVNTNGTDRKNDRSTSTSISTNISSANTTTVTTDARAWSASELHRVEPLAVDYLQRYLRAFDTNRSSLQNAYSEDALFSYRMTLVSPSSTSPSSSFISYRLPQITSALSSILPLYKFCLRDTAVHYDVVSLDAQAGGGILLTVHGALACADANIELTEKSEYDHVVAVDQSFVLQGNKPGNVEESREEGDGDGSGLEATATQACWPLVAVSHHMIVKNLDVRSGRLKYPLPIASISSEHFPWLAS